MKTKYLLAGLSALFLAATPLVQAAQVAPKPAAAASQHQRLLPLEGGRNFRDLGGYRTQDGRTVKWGLLFRSGEMHDLTAADFTYLAKIGIRTVCDFRDTNERAAEPALWPAGQAPRIFADDYDMKTNGMMPKLNFGSMTPVQARAMMAETYPRILTTFNGQYRRMFQQLLAGNAPLAFNCSAGKDRTGVAAALILTALGVPRETVIQDYLLTNQYLNAAKMLQSGAAKGTGDWTKLPPTALQAMMLADRSYIGAALAVVDSHKGGADGYLRDELGLSRADIVKLRDFYLE